MTKKSLSPEDPTIDAGQGSVPATYTAPSLVRYGSLFVETGKDDKNPCSDPVTDSGNDNCDPDGGDVDGPK
jgi:hypothetical protein